MKKVKLIVHEKYTGKQKVVGVLAAVFLSDAAVFLSDAAALTLGESPGIMKSTD